MTLKTTAIVLAAGMGTRMKSELPKVMHNLAGRPMILELMATLDNINIENTVVVVGPDMPELEKAVLPKKTVIQKERLGTGHAVMTAESLINNFDGNILVLFGDTPFISETTIKKMLQERENGFSVVVLGFRTDNPMQYGRLVVKDGKLEKIVEFKDASDEQRKINLCNSGVMCTDGNMLFKLLKKVTNNNAAGEYYLTDIVEIAKADGLKCTVVEGSEEETEGVNSRIDLSRMEARIQKRLREKAMLNGATLVNPETVTFSYDTELGKDVIVEPFVVFGKKVTIGNKVTIKAFTHIEETTIREGAMIGPFARLRPGAEICENVHIGNFVEIKKSVIEKGAKVNHLTYIGDAKIGEKTNVGAGTITCNYDGFNKHFTEVGKGAFIGSDTCLVAPVKIGDGVIIGAGSVITKSIENDALALTRPEHKELKGWAKKFREKNQQKKG